MYSVWSKHPYFLKHLGESLSDGALVCRKHLVEAKRHGKNPEHVPLWKIVVAGNLDSSQNSHHSVKKCSNLQCENVAPDKLTQLLLTNWKKYSKHKAQVSHMFYADNVTTKHTPFLVTSVDYHAALVEFTLILFYLATASHVTTTFVSTGRNLCTSVNMWQRSVARPGDT